MQTLVIIAVAAALLCRVALATTYYVDASRPDDSGDGLSWATAKKTIQAAVDLTADGDTVLVTNGVLRAVGRQARRGATMPRSALRASHCVGWPG